MKIVKLSGGSVSEQHFVMNDQGRGVRLPLPREIVERYGILLRAAHSPEGYPQLDTLLEIPEALAPEAPVLRRGYDAGKLVLK